MTDTTSLLHTDVTMVDDLLVQAIKAHRALDFPAAEAAYRAVLQAEPAHADAHHNLGVLLAVQLLRPLDALSHFEAALNADAERSQFWFSYIDCLIRCQHFDLARQVLPLAQGLTVMAMNALLERLPIVVAPPVVQDAVQPIEPAVIQAAKPPPLSRSKSPGMDGMQRLTALFAKGEFAAGVVSAREMVQKYPQHGFGWKR
jgi:tetratricopeptide (TPR) repeat protein